MTAADDMPDSDQSADHQQRPRALAGVLIALVLLILGGCAGQLPRPGEQPITIHDEEATLPATAETADQTAPLSPAAVDADPEIWSRLRAGFRLADGGHPRVMQEVRQLQRHPNALRALLARSEPYLHHILNEIEAAGLPTELALLPAVESGFRPYVYSPDGAAGLWQFMPATGDMLGLEQDWWFDQRRTVRASTDAAIDYLTRLNERFAGDWLLALAAYNAGAGTVNRALNSARLDGEPTDFWSLDLPGETERYIPRLLALAAIVTDPEPYGLDLPEILDLPYFAIADTAGQIDLNVAADLAGLPVDDLLVLNAGHKRWASRPDGPHELLLPIDKVTTFEQALAALPADARLRWQHYRVRRGDSLNRIAREHGVSVEAIRQSNGLHGSRIRAGEQLVIPLSDSVTFAAAGSNRYAQQRVRYRVRKGDSLYAIAQRFQVSVADLRRWNSVGRYIQPGERLTLFVDPDA